MTWQPGILIRAAVRVAGFLLLAVVVVALLPAAIVAVIGVIIAWYEGWRPARLYRGAAWCVPMLIVWLAVTAALRHSLWPVFDSPVLAWAAAGRGNIVAAAVLLAPWAVPLGLLAAGRAWSFRLASMTATAGGSSPMASASFDDRQWRHQVRAARARVAAPGAVPLLTRRGEFAAGAVIRAIRHPQSPVLRLPARRLAGHQVVIGGSGSGKSTLLLRLWAGFLAAAVARHAAGAAGPPLVVVLDCKGGGDSRRMADRARRALTDAGARSVAIWPDEASLTLWDLPPGQLITALTDFIEHGTGGAAYYTDVMEAAVTLAVQAPPGPPRDSGDFLARLQPGWLADAYADSPEQQAALVPAVRQLGDIAMRFRAVFRRLGAGLDGPGSLADADAWYCILEGTSEVAVAEAQARALVDLIAATVTGPGQPGEPAQPGQPARQVLLAVDEFSAVSRRVPIWQLFERGRSLGLAVQVSAQSWHGLADHDDDRYRIAATAEGGVWLLRTSVPEQAAALAGERSATASSRQLTGSLSWEHAGSSTLGSSPVADPDRVRGLATGQAAYLHRDGVTFVQIKQLVPDPAGPDAAPEAVATDQLAGASRPGEPAGAGANGTAAADAQPAGAALSSSSAASSASSLSAASREDAGVLLDEVFGTWP